MVTGYASFASLFQRRFSLATTALALCSACAETGGREEWGRGTSGSPSISGQPFDAGALPVTAVDAGVSITPVPFDSGATGQPSSSFDGSAATGSGAVGLPDTSVYSVADAGGTDTGFISPSGEPFPRASEAVNVDLRGQYATTSYAGPRNAVFDSSTIYYPTDAQAPFAILALSPGFTNVKEDFLWWGAVMASHGFVIAVLSPTSSLDFPGDRADDLEAGISMLKAENTRSGSPLLGKIDTTRAGLLGHSMGGGAVLITLNRAGTKYQAGVAWEPWEEPNFSSITTATLILSGSDDLVASADDMAWPFYQQIPSSTKKAYAEFAGYGHNTPNNLGSEGEHASHAKWTIAWMKMFLENDSRYGAYITNSTELARFASTL